MSEGIRLDTDGDGRISFPESGFSQDEFALLDGNDSGYIPVWQIGKAIVSGLWPGWSD